MRCLSCGKEIKSSDQKFCRHCGAELDLNNEPSYINNSYIKKGASRGYPKVFISLATVSIVLALVSISIGLPVFFYISSSVYLEYNLGDLLFFEDACTILGYCYHMPEPYYILGEDLEFLTYISGVLLVIFGIIGFLLGIIAMIIRRKARDGQSGKKLQKIGFIFAIAGITLSIIGILIAGILLYIPSYIAEYNRIANQYLWGF